ncbi:hypothetical protein [Kitasatospora sp. NPDC056531]|uniref:hypothetical protein n=1 Tax=Kitasatospora sp. NPDC056531 TaxID=3345856 RepID=UPI0036C84423
MIIDRATAVTPSRYQRADLRKQMGSEIATADSDDLLAAWLWVTEAWFCRDWATQSVAHSVAVRREQLDIMTLCRKSWPTTGDDWAPVSARENVQSALVRALSRLRVLAAESTSLREKAFAAWETMRDEAGFDPVIFFPRRGDRRR